MTDAAWDALLAFVAGYFITVGVLKLVDRLHVPAAPDPIDPIVARERWDVWRAAERLTRGECDATG